MSNDMITITFPEVKVEIPVKDLTFDTLENLIFDIIQAIARKVFTKALFVSVKFTGVLKEPKNLLTNIKKV